MTNVPAGAAELLAFLRKAETGETGEDAYRTIIGHRQGKLSKPVTAFTVDELIAAQVTWGRNWKSSAAGAYQIIRKTLVGLKKSLGLSGSEKFTPELQDRMAMELLRQRGWGRLGKDALALAIAREWASMPVLKAVTGASRQVKRGQSYYAGDGLNKALVSPEEFEAVLDRAIGKPAAPVTPAGQTVTAQQIADVQERLRALGYHEVGAVDGIFGPATENAILIFRKDQGLPLSATIDNSLLAALMKAQPRVVSTERAEATPKEVREQAPEVKDTWWSKVVAFWGAIATFLAGAINFLVTNIGEARTMLKPVTDLLGNVPLWTWGALLGAGLLAIWFKSRASEKKAVAAYQTGERR